MGVANADGDAASLVNREIRVDPLNKKGDANPLGNLGINKSPSGCQRRFGRPLLFRWTYGVEDD